eukprot:2055565-Pyramimonas_sp.AAC.1
MASCLCSRNAYLKIFRRFWALGALHGPWERRRTPRDAGLVLGEKPEGQDSFPSGPVSLHETYFRHLLSV